MCVGWVGELCVVGAGKMSWSQTRRCVCMPVFWWVGGGCGAGWGGELCVVGGGEKELQLAYEEVRRGLGQPSGRAFRPKRQPPHAAYS